MSDKKANITFGTGSDCTIQVSSKVTVPDALVFESGGVVVGRLDAVYDFKDLDPKYHMEAAAIIQKRVRLIIPTDAAFARMDRRRKRRRQLEGEFNSLPWYKKLFTRRPWEIDLE